MTPGKTTIATIHSTGTTTTWAGRHMYVEVDTIDGDAVGFIETNGEVMLDAAALRRLAAACIEGADHLDRLAETGCSDSVGNR
jgi:hypothetical protein